MAVVVTPESLRTQVMRMKKQSAEDFHRYIVEKHVGGKRLRLRAGTTDGTTDAVHAIARHWDEAQLARHTLASMNREAPRGELRAYLFGERCEQARRSAAAPLLAAGMRVLTFRFREAERVVDVVDVVDGEVAFSFAP